jgi:prevent-host-death family protein
MRALTISEFKAKCLAVVDQVDRTGEPVTILKRGRAVARVVPAASGERFPQDSLAGSVEIVGDVLSPVLSERQWDALRPPQRRKRP